MMKVTFNIILELSVAKVSFRSKPAFTPGFHCFTCGFNKVKSEQNLVPLEVIEVLSLLVQYQNEQGSFKLSCRLQPAL